MVKVSVLIPVYGVGKFIERCARSLFNQTFQEVEYIFVNDATKDNSIDVLEKVIKEFPGKALYIHILHHPENRGSAAARNTALAISQGKYIITVDGDDYVEPEMIEDMYRVAQKNKADIVGTDYFVNYKKRQLYRIQYTPSTGIECLDKLLTGELHASTSNKLIRKELFIKNNIRYVEGLNLGEDMSVLFRVCYYAGTVCYLPKAYLHYVQYNVNSYTHSFTERSENNILQLVEMVENFFNDKQIKDVSLQRALMFYKLSAKVNLLVGTTKKRRKQYFHLYPEAVPYIKEHPVLPWYYKWLLRMASARFYRGLYWGIDFILFAKWFKA
ncbi:MAG: glycosyltransferase family 2 protein [Odoribacter splanchnicus]